MERGWICLVLLLTSKTCIGLQLFRPWISQNWCDSIIDPHWPLEYEKIVGEWDYEPKGRTTSNRKNLGHVCDIRGASSKCHRCEDIACGDSLSEMCHMQVQGMPWSNLSKNTMALWDVPWAVGGSHRNDFQGGTHACYMVQGGDCLEVNRNDVDFRQCSIRCIGYGEQIIPIPKEYIELTPDPIEDIRNESVGWEWPEILRSKRPQGKVRLVAGTGVAGYLDGAPESAQFNSPLDVVVDKYNNVFVADTGNHVIRRIDGATGQVSTLAGTPGVAGMQDGTSALFNAPRGIALYYDWSVKYDGHSGSPISRGVGDLVLVISDSRNHRIRKIVLQNDGTASGSVNVETLAGRLGLDPEPGYSDGDPTEALFNAPYGIAADDEGMVFVADSNNHLVRSIEPSGLVSTVAGTLIPVVPPQGCKSPCLIGEQGGTDGALNASSFSFPSALSLGPENTILVVDANRVRRITRPGTTSVIQGETYQDSVTTLAGQPGDDTGGMRDGNATEATFDAPAGIAIDSNTGRIFVSDSASCRIRRITPANQVTRPVTCTTTLDMVFRPNGCSSYDTPVDSMYLTVTDVVSNIHYNYLQRAQSGMQDGWVVGREGYVGRRYHSCLGTPPPQNGTQNNGNTLGPHSDTDYESISAMEDVDLGTAIYVECPSGCAANAASVYGGDNGLYADGSSICLAAVHQGLFSVGQGGLVRVIANAGTVADMPGSASVSGVTSQTLSGGSARTFSLEVYPVNQIQIATIAGAPGAPLEESCGTFNASAEYDLPLKAHFNKPAGISLPRNVSLSDNTEMYIADSGNNAIRAITASCAKVCENGGQCVGDETCQCATGWEGDDCTIPICSTPCSGTRQLCVAPDTCDCVPGYTGMPACTQALCVQSCEHGGVCVAPDTCSCADGWIDGNCTTPVCEQTCGNGANCTSSNTCSCPLDWTGHDCRTPVCRQTCQNGGNCTAPDTCTCPPSWSGHDCSLPVCTQGFLFPDPSSFVGSPATQAQRASDFAQRPISELALTGESDGTIWRSYVACEDFETDTWCDATNGFDCAQQARINGTVKLDVPRDAIWRHVTGLHPGDDSIPRTSSSCIRIELTVGARTPYPYENASANNSMTSLWRYTPETPYSWDSFAQGPDLASQWDAGIRGWRASDTVASDRMVAHVQWVVQPQGVYVCANGGECVAPDTCKCAPGWIGFDCRTPVCISGYYEPPTDQGTVILKESGEVPQDYPDQGLYECSIRSVTEWENDSYIHDHPNYYSRYMDHHSNEWSPARYQVSGPESPHYWDGMGWPFTHEHTEPDGNHTNRGWTRKGYWVKSANATWKKGKCTVEYARTCPGDMSKSMDVRTLMTGTLVTNTDAAYRPVVSYDDKHATAMGRWFQAGGECVDQVIRGCKNNGTCVGPNLCECAPGWTGADCTIPVCEQHCSRPADEDLGYDNNNLRMFSKGTGNCTLPNTCTCEKGWEGEECEIPICAQECNHGKCTAPDTCTCSRWESKWHDNRLDGGRPLYQDQNGNAQLTGWTGYDCNTPICVQSVSFERNINALGRGNVSLGGYGLILYGQEPYNNYNVPTTSRTPPYLPYSWSHDINPIKIWSSHLRDWNDRLWASSEDYLEEDYQLCRLKGYDCCANDPTCYAFTYPKLGGWGPGDGEIVNNNGRSYQSGCKYDSGRFSDFERSRGIGFLCNVLEWEQGDYAEGRYIRVNNEATNYLKNLSSILVNSADATWYAGNPRSGEGVYACANQGSCVAPDKCSCPDGYTGDDCATPLCRFIQEDGTQTSCGNGGKCAAKDYCSCEQTESVLHQTVASAPRGTTGYTGSDCSIPMCVQGTFDGTCKAGFSPGGEGCFRCKNGGNCTAPDHCTCPPEWTGHDCGTPVCTLRADEYTIRELQTADLSKISDFEKDPCQTNQKVWWNNMYIGQGNCTAPNTCTCLCMNRAYVDPNGELTGEIWQDPFKRGIPMGYTRGTLQCLDGFEGVRDYETGLFKSCHLQIYVPSWFERNSIFLIVLAGTLLIMALIAYIIIRRRIRRRYYLLRAAQKLKQAENEANKPRKHKSKSDRKDRSSAKKKRHTNRKVGKLE